MYFGFGKQSGDCVTCFDITCTFIILKFIVKMRNMDAINSLEKTDVTSGQKVLQGLPKNIDASACKMQCNANVKLIDGREVKKLNRKCLGHDGEPQRGTNGPIFFQIVYIFPGRAASQTVTRERPVQLEQLYDLLLSLESSELEFLT